MNTAFWNNLTAFVVICGVAIIALSRVQPETGTLATASPAALEGPPAAQVGRMAPDIRLQTPTGETIDLAELRGQVVLVNIWATWCPPCRSEMPMIEAAYRRYHEQGFEVLAVNLREDATTVADFMQQNELTFPALLDLDGAVAGSYRASVVPLSAVIDRQGVVRAVYRGPLPNSVIAGMVEPLLVEE